MSNQGAPPQHLPEDGWWHAVYTGPAASLPDTPDATADRGSVDDWFDSAAGMIGAQRTTEPASAAAATASATAEPGLDDWFESAVVAIGPQRTTDADTAPAVAEPVAEPEPEPVAEPEPEEPPTEPAPEEPAEPVPPRSSIRQPHQPPLPHIGERPPTYGPEPTALPLADPDTLAAIVPDTVVEGAQYGAATLRAASVRGDSARYRGESRRDALVVTRFGEGEEGLLLAVLAAPSRTQVPSPAAAEACRQLAAAVGRSRSELSADLRAGARDRLRYGLQRLTARAISPIRSTFDEPSDQSEQSDAGNGSLHCLLISLDPATTHRAAFGIGPGALFLLRSGHWIDAYAARLLHHPDGRAAAPVPAPVTAAQAQRPFRFRLVPATPGDILLLCTPGLAEPLAEEPAVAQFLTNQWAHPTPPGMVDFCRQVQVRAKGYADDRTAAALWTEQPE